MATVFFTRVIHYHLLEFFPIFLHLHSLCTVEDVSQAIHSIQHSLVASSSPGLTMITQRNFNYKYGVGCWLKGRDKMKEGN